MYPDGQEPVGYGKTSAAAPALVWPGVINGEKFDRKVLEDFYRPWTDLVKQGVGGTRR